VITKSNSKRSPTRHKFADEKYMGPEPDTDIIIENRNDVRLTKAFNWYNYFYDNEAAKTWLVDYMGSNYSKQITHGVKTSATWRMSFTLGAIARLLSRGWTLPEQTISFLNTGIINLSKHGRKARTEVVVSVQDRIRDKANQFVYGTIDEHIDRFIEDKAYKFSLYELLAAEKPSPVACNMLREKLQAIYDEVGLKEGYEYLSVKDYKSTLAFYKIMLADVDRYHINKKTTRSTTRKPRLIKEQSADKLVAKVKYKKTDPELQLVSAPPHSLIKSQMAWIYNAKYKQISVYYASNEAGLSVKGTTITNFNELTSITKRVRKPKEVMQSILIGSKASLKKFMDTLKTASTPAKGRMNEDSVIVRVIK
jgi:hypothetical protein